jgi:hypothetical protein
METLNEFIASFQLEMKCKHLDSEDIHRMFNSFMDSLDQFVQSNGWSKTVALKYHREIVKSRLFCLMDKLLNGFITPQEKVQYIDDVNEVIEEHIKLCILHSNRSCEYSMVSDIFI